MGAARGGHEPRRSARCHGRSTATGDFATNSSGRAAARLARRDDCGAWRARGRASRPSRAPDIAELIDVGRLETLMSRWPERDARADPGVIRDYRLALLRALSVSRYLRWFDCHAATTTARSR